MRWYRNLNFLYNMKKVTIVFDFESQSMDVSVNDACECVTNAATVEEMLAKEVFAFRPVKTSHYVVLHYADIVCVKASNNNSVFHMADGSCFTVGRRLEVVEKFLRESSCGGFVRVNRSAIVVAEHSRKIDFFVRTSLPPVEGIFYDGQLFDAYKFATDLIRSARVSLLLIDNYVDESVLLMLSKRNVGVKADIYTQAVSQQLQLDVQKHNSQYPPIGIHTYKKCHDRFLIIDGTDVYHIGASLKDLGKKMFAFSKLEIPAAAITALL